MTNIIQFFKKKDNINDEEISFLKSKHYDVIQSLGKGVFGQVFACRHEDSGQNVAIKIVPSLNVRKLESELWDKLLHPNVMPLLDFMKLEGSEIFIMPVARSSLYDCLKNKRFRKNDLSLQITTRWLRDVLHAIDYLHGVHVCHLDVKVDNILITNNMKAVLSDYSCVNTTEEKVAGYGLMPWSRPPETCPYTGQWKTSGDSFDLWSFGMMVLHIFTFEWMEGQFEDDVIYWQRNIYPRLFEVLQMPHFGNIVHSTFPKISGCTKEVEQALNLIQSTLRYQPWERPKSSVILRHSLLCKDERGLILQPDDIWQVDFNNNGLFTSLDAEKPSTMPRRIREIKRKKSLKREKICGDQTSISDITHNGKDVKENVNGFDDNVCQIDNSTKKEGMNKGVHTTLGQGIADNIKDNSKDSIVYRDELTSNTELGDCVKNFSKEELDFIKVIKEKACIVKSDTQFETTDHKHSTVNVQVSKSLSSHRICQENLHTKPCRSDSALLKMSSTDEGIDAKKQFHPEKKDSFVFEDSSAGRVSIGHSTSLGSIQCSHENLASKTCQSDSAVLKKSFFKGCKTTNTSSEGLNSVYESNLKYSCDRAKQTHEDLHDHKDMPAEFQDRSVDKDFVSQTESRKLKSDLYEVVSQGDTGIGKKFVVFSATKQTSTDSLKYDIDEETEKQSRRRLIEEKCESATCFQEERECHNIKVSVSDSTNVSEYTANDDLTDTITLQDMLSATRMKKTPLKNIRDWFKEKWNKYCCCSCSTKACD